MFKNFLNYGLTVIALCIASSALAYEYRTPEFRDPDGPVPVMFLCMFLGDKYRLDPDAPELIMDVMIGNGVTPEDFDRWQQDATHFVASTLDGNAPIDIWRAYSCDAKVSEVRRILGR